MRGNKLHVDEAKKDRQRPAALAQGGKGRMFPEQAAGPVKSGVSGKVQTPAPGAKAARGGQTKMSAFTPAKPAKPGITGAR